MPVRANSSGVASSVRGMCCILAVLVAMPLLLTGCHDEARLRQRLEGPPKRLPVKPDTPDTPPAPALLDTVRDWRQPDAYVPRTIESWITVTARASDDLELSYRVPAGWVTDKRAGESNNLRETIDAHAGITQLDDSEISLATYAAQLAEGNPLFQYTTDDGHVVYLTRREVALAPTDPDAVREVFHTAVVSVDGHIAKLDVRYVRELNWRFDELAAGITGTLQVRRRTAA